MVKNVIIISIFCISFNAYCQSEIDPNGFNKIYYPNGSLQSEGTLKDGKPEGYWINYYPTGVKKSEGNRNNYKLDGIWIFYNIVGDTISKISYKNGEKNGYTYTYTEKPKLHAGNIASRELYVRNKREGTGYYYYEDGELKEIRNYENDLTEGKAYVFAKDGRVITIKEYRKGSIIEKEKINRYNSEKLKSGVWQEYYEGYRIKKESNYRAGLLDGYYKEYDKNGKLIVTVLYRNGKLVEQISDTAVESIEQKRFYEDGKIQSVGSYIEQRPVGIHKVYTKNGEVKETKIYNEYSELVQHGIIDRNGKRKGEWEEYYRSGKLKAKGKYEDNLKEGEWKYYFENGNIEQIGRFKRGKYTGVWKWFYKGGEIWKEEEFMNGLAEGYYMEYDRLGNIIVEGEYFDGEREGKWKTIVNDYRAEGNYVTGFMDGKWRHYHDNQMLAFEGSYIQGNAQGKHRYFYNDGTLKEEQYYNNGIPEKHWKKYNELGKLIITISYKNGREYRINGIKVDFPLVSKKVIE